MYGNGLIYYRNEEILKGNTEIQLFDLQKDIQ